MTKLIPVGIRREDKNEWEKRVPLIPDHLRILNNQNIKLILQPSPVRVFCDNDYQQAGAEINESLKKANTIFAVKEIPTSFFEQDKTYVFFPHVIKGQAYNMDMLRRMMELKCNLIDYERIINQNNQRLIFFGRFAGLAGMIETFYAYGQKLKRAGHLTPFQSFKQAFQYGSIEQANEHICEICKKIENNGFSKEIDPIVVGFAGYGNVSRGAQEIFDLLPFEELVPKDLKESYAKLSVHNNKLFKVVFKEQDMVIPKEGDFILQDYYANPGRYVGTFDNYLPYLTILVNCIYWTDKYPRLVTKDYLKTHHTIKPTLKVIGDISCDIEGSIEITKKVTYPDKATYTYLPEQDIYHVGTHKDGITVMAIDNLPCEFPRESSTEFSTVLVKYVKDIAQADFRVAYDRLILPYPIKKALILHCGELTDEYRYIQKYL